MAGRWTLCVCVALAAGVCRGGTPDEAKDAKKKAERVASYVTLVETITRVGIQVGAMLEKHPFDRALGIYTRDLGRLHAKALGNLTPPEGAESLHEKFKDAVLAFARMGEAFCAGDYPTARKQREDCVRDFNRALLEAIRLKKEGVVP